MSNDEIIQRAVKNALDDFYQKKSEAPIRSEVSGSFRTDEYVAPEGLGVTGITVTTGKQR
ncbi:MAG: hypothetical protein PWP63_1350 [Methanolobus sp.]|nr:hypothetical protein [Methanolobus sp.]